MKTHNSELVGALIDGELKGLRLWLAKRHIGRCAICAAEYRHVVHVREMLKANPVQPVMSDSADFFWSKVKREIQAGSNQTARVPVPRLSLADWLSQRREVMIGGATVLVAAVALVVAVGLTRASNKKLARMETSTTVFDTDDGDSTVIWVTGLPWSKDMNDMQTVLAGPTS
jgi:anti-sigma factor RsiW